MKLKITVKKILMIIVSIVATNLAAMIPAQDLSLVEIIDAIEQGQLEERPRSIIADLTTIALHNPGNLIARAYLWAIEHQKFRIASENGVTKAPLLGMAQVMANQFEQAPHELRSWIARNFLRASVLATDMARENRRHDLVVAIQRMNMSHANASQRLLFLSHIKGSDELRKSIRRQKMLDLLALCNQDFGSLRALQIVTTHFPENDFGSLEYFIHGSVHDKNMQGRLLKLVKNNVLTRNYFGRAGALTDGKLEASLVSQANGDALAMLGFTSVTLGQEEFLLERLYEMLSVESFATRASFSTYVARIVGNSETLLIAAIDQLNGETSPEKALADFEDFLSMEEASIEAMNKATCLYLRDESRPDFSPYVFVEYYLNLGDTERAIEIFFQLWRKGFMPKASFSSYFIMKLEELNVTSNINYLALVAEKFHDDDIKDSSHRDCYLATIYFTIDADYLQKYFGNWLKKMFEVDFENDDDSRLTTLNMLVNFMVLMDYDERLWNNRDILDSITKYFVQLEHAIDANSKPDYFYMIFRLTLALDRVSDASVYLQKASEAGHEMATILYHSYLDFQMKIKRHRKESAAKTVPSDDEVDLFDLSATSSGTAPVENSKTLAQKTTKIVQTMHVHNDHVVVVSSREQAINNITAFIEKWQKIHWKNSVRSELINDFRKMVLLNDAVTSGDSNHLHGNHGRRYAKYGTKASSFEIKTLIERAEKLLLKL